MGKTNIKKNACPDLAKAFPLKKVPLNGSNKAEWAGLPVVLDASMYGGTFSLTDAVKKGE